MKPGFCGLDVGTLGVAVVTGDPGAMTITIASIAINITSRSMTVIITSLFHVVNTQARTAAARSRMIRCQVVSYAIVPFLPMLFPHDPHDQASQGIGRGMAGSDGILAARYTACT